MIGGLLWLIAVWAFSARLCQEVQRNFESKSFWVNAGAVCFQLWICSLVLLEVKFPEHYFQSVLSWPLVFPFALFILAVKSYTDAAVPLLAAICLGGLIASYIRKHSKSYFLVILPTVFILAGSFGFLVVGEMSFQLRLKQSTQSFSPSCLSGGSFMEFFRNANDDTHLNAKAQKDGELYGWSFRRNNFFKLPSQPERNPVAVNSSWWWSPYPACR